MEGKKAKFEHKSYFDSSNYQMEEIYELHAHIHRKKRCAREIETLTRMIVHIYNSLGCNRHSFPLVFDILGRPLYGL